MLKENPSEEQAIWLKGPSVAKLGVNLKFLPGTPQSFWKISWPLEDVEKTEGPASKGEHPADIPSTTLALEECAPGDRSENGSTPEIVSDRSQT